MDALDYIVDEVRRNAVECDVYSPTDDGAYSGDLTKTDTVSVHIFDPTSSSLVVTEGSGSEASLTGLVVPDTDRHGTVTHHVTVNDQLRVQSNPSKRYDVRGKDPIDDALNPDLFRLGLDRANSSQ